MPHFAHATPRGLVAFSSPTPPSSSFRSPQIGRSTERLIGASVEAGRPRPPFLSQLSGQTFYNNEYGQLSEEAMGLDFFSVPDDLVSEGSCPASSNL